MRHDEAMLLQGYRKISREQKVYVQDYIGFFLEKNCKGQQEKQERRNGFTVVAGAGKKGGEEA